MPSVDDPIKSEKPMASTAAAGAAGDAGEPRREEKPPAPTPAPAATAAAVTARPSGPGFFTIYKKGQGYWTRMGTAAGAFLLCLLVGNFVYTQLRAWFSASRSVAFGAGAGVFAVLALFVWRVMNKPTAVDFLIATDSEMKKVNWTTRKELIGSTKVVIFFVLLISLLLFLIDLAFGYLFHLIRVLEFGPFQ
jgi:preprotein translocase SecE subunit